ncbi:MAG: Gfo/Idh/MocA family oxidoreductase [Defluviitaleaceae bacterium]|nr:Gfo/Idh/MocA family oxidoreductase [Defluviitaleaceae bacterium]
MKTYRIAAIGFAHSHIIEVLKSFADCGERVQIVAAADVKPRIQSINVEHGTRIAEFKNAIEKYGCKAYEDYTQLIDEQPLDIALICCENAYHPVVAEKLLQRGIHVVMEKPMAADMPGAMRIIRAARETGAKVITNWPAAWNAPIRTAKALCDAGEIGKLFKFTYRNGDSLGALSYGQVISDLEKGREWWHQADVGGGALLDYCCYGACMSGWFLKAQPTAAYGLKANFDSPYASAEDYATITVRFPHAVALLEGSWTTVNTGVPNGPVIYGTEGTIVVRNDRVEVFKTRSKDTPDQVITPDPLPAGRDTLGREVLHHLDTGEPLFPMLDVQLNLQAMSILDAGIRSAASGKLELAQDAVWCVGNDPF